MKKIAMTALLAVALTSCTSGPGKGEVEEALGQFFQQTAGVRPSFEDLKVGGCQKAEGGPGYACSVSAIAVFNAGSRAQREPLTNTFVFDEVGGHWKVIGTR